MIKTDFQPNGAGRAGFTIIEILIIVGLFTLLAAFGLANYRTMVRKNQERVAVMNLMSIHAANEIRDAKVNQYLQGIGLVLAQINNGLELEIINPEANMVYGYSDDGGVGYDATAAWTGDNAYTLNVDEQPLEDGVNPCCSVGVCPTVPGC